MRKTTLFASAVLGAAAGALGLGAACGGAASSAITCEGGCDQTVDGATGSVDGGVTETADARVDSTSSCPSGNGPTMVAVPSMNGGAFCVDSTEVTNAQYAAFLASTGNDTSHQIAACSSNSTFEPGGTTDNYPCDPAYDPVGRADFPVVCVDWCDAYAFCAWAGGTLCGNGVVDDAGHLALGHTDGWQRACSSGEKYNFPYGDTYQPGRCVDGFGVGYDGAMPVGSATGCQSPDPSYAGVFDLVNNVAEWAAECDIAFGSGDSCEVVSLGACVPLPDAGPAFAAAVTERPRSYHYAGLGFRCCAIE